jgi:hypothetical protein
VVFGLSLVLLRYEQGEAGSPQHLVSRHLVGYWTFGYESHQTFSIVPGDGTEVLRRCGGYTYEQGGLRVSRRGAGRSGNGQMSPYRTLEMVLVKIVDIYRGRVEDRMGGLGNR